MPKPRVGGPAAKELATKAAGRLAGAGSDKSAKPRVGGPAAKEPATKAAGRLAGEGGHKARSPERQKLIEDHMRLVWHIARTRFGGRDAEELVSVGWVALVTAADLFDPTRGIQFTTYAYHRIWGYMRSEVKRLKAERARPRADFELEFELDLADKPRSSVFESKELAAQCLSRLRGTDREIIEAIFFEGRTRRELAKKRGCSHQFISQVYRRAMGRMKDSLR